ncbi:hypothetical protein H072_7508 [Dactylellina haptotyla CBS 200.50]|uniref:tRNA (adenine(58)-N(1))-methyltransferase catalytic subunit TRM61 n=1 Tax=Dactylellina haptotyla (strain CBS 200.50) TaxID=1284197 RepID=S8BHB8_DACHA|nr:hypothetical protein H072_7508 [Dactylellina haptotyla CBS 200.50]
MRSWVRIPSYPYSTVLRAGRRHKSSNASITKEGDCLYLKPRSSLARARDSFFLPKIKPGEKTVTHKGNISHDDLIGRRVRDIVKTHTGSEYLVTFPTMDEYIVNAERIVTPIYPADAAAIVQSLDLHVSPSIDDSEGPLEVLEAGTGHGSLTLHLARALSPGYMGVSPPAAILHSIEKSKSVVDAAENLLKGFRRGMYHGEGVKFYHADVEDWLKKQIAERDSTAASFDKSTFSSSSSTLTSETSVSSSYTPFLSSCVLDMPDIRPIMPLLQQAMHPGAILGYWAPSITQITSVVEHTKLKRIPFYVEKVLEFGNGVGGAGARVWDVRLAQVRSRVKAAAPQDTKPRRASAGLRRFFEETEKQKSSEGFGQVSDAVRDGVYDLKTSPSEDIPITEDKSDWEMVCRPKTGERTQGGGFYLIMRRIGQQPASHLADDVQ